MDLKTIRLFWRDEYRPQIYDNFKREIRDTDQRLFCWEGIENGINIEYKFSRIEGSFQIVRGHSGRVLKFSIWYKTITRPGIPI